MIFASFLKAPLVLEKFSDKRMIYGAWLASERFYKGILNYGTFNEYHFFINSSADAREFKDNLTSFCPEPDRVKVIKIDEMIPCLKKIEYTTFFTDNIPALTEITYLRSHYAKALFPIAAIMPSTISYPQMLREEFFNNMLSDTQPFDSLICTSRAQLKAIQNLNRLVSGYFKRRRSRDIIRYNGRLDLLPMGIKASDYDKIDKFQARKKLNLPHNKIIILYLGRFSIHDKMDLEPLLVAFKTLLKQKEDILLLFAAQDTLGRYSDKVKTMAKDMGLISNVRFFLSPSLDNRYSLYAASDIFVSPSDNIQESFGLTILEAMSAGLPVVASDWNGYRDTIVHGETGFLIPTYWMDCDREMSRLSTIKASIFGDHMQDHLYLAQAMCVDVGKMTGYLSILIKDKDLRLELGQNGRDRILEKYDWRVLIPKYERLCKRLFDISKDYKSSRKKMLVPRYVDCFRHYPARMLSNEDKIAITQNGMGFLKAKKIPHIPAELKEALPLSMIFMILTFSLNGGIIKISKVESHIKRIFKWASHDNIRFHIMWLLKKDLIALK